MKADVTPTDVQTLVQEPARAPWWRRARTWVALLLLGASVAGWQWWAQRSATQAAPRYSTEPITRGSITLTVTANGTLQPTRTVSIGSELSGTVARVMVDVNDRVKKGQVLVELDTSKLSDQIARSKATLASTQAKLAAAEATAQESVANLARLEEVARLSGGKVPAATELDASRAAGKRAQADRNAARAAVADAQAALRTDTTNLAKASIRAPTDGVVLTRAVDPGNAVAASLQAVTLFTLAEDLSQLKLQVNVDEADVGRVTPGRPASFTVAAHPGRRFPATITRVAFGSTITDNVVTYATQMDVANPDGSLRPGMTATASITATERQGVLRVPAPALRFTPAAAGASAAAASGGGSLVSRLMPRPPGNTSRRAGGGGLGGAGERASVQRTLWVLQDGQPQALKVTVGISDGRYTEVSGDGLAEGLQVITEQRVAKSN
ncbi:RND family efflux transporter, MFP subunit [Burkholderiales bacterium JOSHI_001]|nr:RND family efflux transporter, MFP subunit [Burkholderiales bacterium JOSHI_001]